MSTSAPARPAAPELPLRPEACARPGQAGRERCGPDTEIDAYTYGRCHVLALAIALHARPAEPDMVFSLLVVTDPTQACWTDPRDQDNRIDSVVHVFASDGVSAWDIHGRRRIADVEDCCKRIFGTMITEVHMLEPPELALFIDRGSQGERPLSPFRAAEIEEAWHVAERRLGLARDMSGEREASARRILRHLTGSHDSQWPSPACAEEGMEPC